MDYSHNSAHILLCLSLSWVTSLLALFVFELNDLPSCPIFEQLKITMYYDLQTAKQFDRFFFVKLFYWFHFHVDFFLDLCEKDWVLSKCKLIWIYIAKVATRGSSVQDGIYALGKAHVHSTSSQKFPERCLWNGLFCLPVYLLSHFPSLQLVQGNTSTGVFVGGCRPLTHSTFHFL